MKDGKLEPTLKALAEYRSTRKNRKVPIPNHLRDKILSHLGQYSVPDLAERLSVADCLIYKWKKAKNATLLKEKVMQASPFVELALDRASTGAIELSDSSSLVEFSRPDGATMRFPMSLQPETLNILITNFFWRYIPMLSLTASSRIFLAVDAVDFRKGIDGVIGLCKSQLAQDPRNGAVFAFINRDKSRIKLLAFDDTGYWLCMKRLSEGRFVNWPTGEEKIASVDAKKILILLMGPKPSAPGVLGEWKKIS